MDRSRARVAAAIGQQKRKQNEERKAALETDVVDHTVPDNKRFCPKCASDDMTTAAPQERVDYGYVPGYFRRRVHRQEVLVCTCCATRVAAEAPTRPFEKSPYEAGLIAHVVVQKCACSVPIYRLEKQFQWLGIPLSRSTMTDLLHAAAEKLKPLYLRLIQRVANSAIVLADEGAERRLEALPHDHLISVPQGQRRLHPHGAALVRAHVERSGDVVSSLQNRCLRSASG